MKVRTARNYLDLGPEVFRREIIRKLPAVVLGGRRYYAKRVLDKWIEDNLGRPLTVMEKDWLSHIDADIQN